MPETGTTILLAEDDIILGELYQERLKAEGFSVVHANNGEDALRWTQEQLPACVILDIMMPKMNGIDVFKALKEQEETAKIPVIIVTALVHQIEQVQQLMSPNDAYVVKSEVLPADIIAMVQQRIAAANDAEATKKAA